MKGGGKGASGWFPVTQSNVAYDHTSFLQSEHALLLDFVNMDLDPSARVAMAKAMSPNVSHIRMP